MPRPIARRAAVGVCREDRSISVAGHALPPLAALTWHYADGSRDVPTLAATMSNALGTSITVVEVWECLDLLSDAGLLERRGSPPAMPSRPWTRRQVLQTAVLSLVAGGSVPLVSRDTRATEIDEKSAASTIEGLRRREQQALQGARDARQRGAKEEAASFSEAAKKASRERAELERQSEQAGKQRRHEAIDAAGSRRAPTSAQGSPTRPTEQSGVPTPDASESWAPIDRRPIEPSRDRDAQNQRRQEQELKNTQERNEKRLRQP